MTSAMIGDRVLSRWRVDGFYYPGQIIHCVQKKHVLVCFDMGILQNTEKQFLITEADSAANRSQGEKYVLMKSRPWNGLDIVRYVPAIITFQKGKKKSSNSLTVVTYREKQLRVAAKDVVRITQKQYFFILKHLSRAQREDHESMYGPEAYFANHKAITIEKVPSDDLPIANGNHSGCNTPDVDEHHSTGRRSSGWSVRSEDMADSVASRRSPEAGASPISQRCLPPPHLASTPLPSPKFTGTPSTARSIKLIPDNTTGAEPTAEPTMQHQLLAEQRKLYELQQEAANKLEQMILQHTKRGGPRELLAAPTENELRLHSPVLTQNSREQPESPKEQGLINGQKLCSECEFPPGTGDAIINENLNIFLHTHCFQCGICKGMFGDTVPKTDASIQNGILHCSECYEKSKTVSSQAPNRESKTQNIMSNPLKKETKQLNEASNLLSKESELVNEDSELLNEASNPLNEESELVNEDSELLNEASNPLNKDSELLNEASNALNNESELLNEESKPLNGDSKPITKDLIEQVLVRNHSTGWYIRGNTNHLLSEWVISTY